MTSKRGKRADKDALELGTDKLYFKIGEVAEIVGVAAHVLRYWESEFSLIKPQKSRSQQRVYRRKDVENLLRIKHLLYERKFTVAGARQELRQGSAKVDPAPPSNLYRARQSL
ncbi:MAG: MerR family transcriptional regulator, partial [Myxococcales bacterium]|nr:MerR family transcriptional regulator [Myxococcales bacterium]